MNAAPKLTQSLQLLSQAPLPRTVSWLAAAGSATCWGLALAAPNLNHTGNLLVWCLPLFWLPQLPLAPLPHAAAIVAIYLSHSLCLASYGDTPLLDALMSAVLFSALAWRLRPAPPLPAAAPPAVSLPPPEVAVLPPSSAVDSPACLQAQILAGELAKFPSAEIVRRAKVLHQTLGISIPEAFERIMTLRRADIAAFYTDARSFTAKSKNNSLYVPERVVPNVQDLADISEAHQGISRTSADAVMVYFDQPDQRQRVLGWLSAGFASVQKIDAWNQFAPEEQQVRRFILMSYGPAWVGNIGGRNGAREITALGPCLNVLQRIDMLTKEPALHSVLQGKQIILTSEAAAMARLYVPGLSLQALVLADYQLKIKNFEEESILWIIPVTHENQQILDLVAKSRRSARRRADLAV